VNRRTTRSGSAFVVYTTFVDQGGKLLR